MRQMRRLFGVELMNGGKLRLVAFFSENERKAVCENKANHTRPITMAEWKQIPKEMKV